MDYKFNLKRDEKDERDYKFSRTISPHSDLVLPKRVDLREKCPPIYDQGKLGACTAFTGCACREMLLDEKETLSELFLYYVERDLNGDVKKDSGASLRDTCKAINKIGVCEEKLMPYNIEKFDHHPGRHAVINASKYRISAYKSLASLDEIKQNLTFRQQPVMIGMDVYESFKSKETAETGIMFMPRKDEKKLGGHAVLVVGYKDVPKKRGYYNKHNNNNSGYLIIRNSWGENWGDKGYFYMPYEYADSDYTYDYWIME